MRRQVEALPPKADLKLHWEGEGYCFTNFADDHTYIHNLKISTAETFLAGFIVGLANASK